MCIHTTCTFMRLQRRLIYVNKLSIFAEVRDQTMWQRAIIMEWTNSSFGSYFSQRDNICHNFICNWIVSESELVRMRMRYILNCLHFPSLFIQLKKISTSLTWECFKSFIITHHWTYEIPLKLSRNKYVKIVVIRHSK